MKISAKNHLNRIPGGSLRFGFETREGGLCNHQGCFCHGRH